MKTLPSFVDLSDRDLLAHVMRLADDERRATAALIASLAEVDARRLYLGEGCSSLFTWCTQVLHLSEHATYGRIEAARAARSFPLVLERLATGEVTLTAIGLLRPHLTVENHRELLDAVRHKSKRDVEHLVAALRPRPDVAPAIRKLPAPRHAASRSQEDSRFAGLELEDVPGAPGSAALTTNTEPLAAPSKAPAASGCPPAPPGPPVVAPLAPERYKVQFTVSRETHDKLRRAQVLLRHTVPNGDPAEIFDRALTLLVERLERTKLAQTKRTGKARPAATRSRRIPAAVRREVWKRDGGRCAFVGAAGRCVERAFLEFHHVVPYARGGAATVDNIQLRCRAHNEYEAEQEFGVRATMVRETAIDYGNDVQVWRRPPMAVETAGRVDAASAAAST